MARRCPSCHSYALVRYERPLDVPPTPDTMRLKREQSIDEEPANLIKEWNSQIGRVETDIKKPKRPLFCMLFLYAVSLKGIIFILLLFN